MEFLNKTGKSPIDIAIAIEMNCIELEDSSIFLLQCKKCHFVIICGNPIPSGLNDILLQPKNSHKMDD